MRATASFHNFRFAVLLLAPLVLFASILSSCTQRDAASADAVTVRDSAGIRIVESHAPIWRSGEGWRLSDEPIVEIRGTGEFAEEMPLDPASAFRAADGRIIVADGMFSGWHAVMVFDAQGRYLETWGGEGEGPCEFGQLWWAAPYLGDSVAVHDYYRHTISIFDTHGECGRVLRLPTWQPTIAAGTYGFSDGADGVFADGSFLAYPSGYLDISSGPGVVWYRHALLHVSRDAAVWDSLGEFEIGQRQWDGTRQNSRAFAPWRNVAVARAGFWFGTGESFTIANYDTTGTVLRIVRRAHEPQPVSAENRARFGEAYIERVRTSREGGSAAADRAREFLRTLPFAEHFPAYSRLLVDDEDNLWVEEYRWWTSVDAVPDVDSSPWSVFDADGRWLGQVDVPARLQLVTIAGDEIIGFWKDDDGVADVQIYRLLR